MNSEKLKRANELYEVIELLRDQITKWERAGSFDHERNVGLSNSKSTGKDYIDVKFIPFDITKTLTLDALRKELNKAENEFISI